MLIVIVFVLIISTLSFVQSNHFLGGTISWRPMNNQDQHSTIPVMFTQSYQWTKSLTNCNQSRIYNLGSVPQQNDTLKCVSSSSLCGGFKPLYVQGYCIDSSDLLDSRSTRISNVENITAASQFCIAFQSGFWTTIRSPSCSFTCTVNNAKWSIGICINLTMRSEGFINTSPVAAVISPIIVPVNSSINITIPVIDADSDFIRCRWARSTAAFDECGDICGPITGSTLDSKTCILTFNSTGKVVGDYYGVALMVEDFPNASINTSFSSVPVQFLIKISNTPCSLKPTIYSNVSNCTAIEVGTQFNFIVTITQGCSDTSIVNFFTVSPLNMTQTNLTRNIINNTWIVTHTWIPTAEQLGPNIYCAVAMDNASVQSDQYCLKFNVVQVEESLICPEYVEQTTTTTVTTLPTAAPVQTVIRTVVVPDTSNPSYHFSDLDLALGLGLSLPLLLIFSGLICCKCFCQQSKFFSSIFSRRNKTDSAEIESNKKSVNLNDIKENKDVQNSLPDYRQQYVKENPKPRKNNPMKISSEKRPLTSNNSSVPTPSLDFDRNSMNITRTTFVSPSTNSFATNDIQFTRVHSLKGVQTENHGSLLVRAYCNQENQKSIL